MIVLRQIAACFGLALVVASPSFADSPTSKDYVTFWAPMIGDWKVAIEAADKTYEGEWKLQTAENQACLQGRANIAGLINAATLEGLDAESHGWQRHWYDSDGGYQRDQVTIDNIKQNKLQTGSVIRVDTSVLEANGHTTSYKSHWRFTKVEPDALEMVVAQGPLGSEATITLTRNK